MTTNQKRLTKLIIRDVLFIAITINLWILAMIIGPADGVWSLAISVVTGLMTVLIGYLLHEWGHLIGAWMRGSVVHLPASTLAVFLFRFDTAQNNREQFLAMSAGGFISSLLVVTFLIVALPPKLLASYIALGLTGLGVLATFILEIPPAWRVLRGKAVNIG